MKRLRQFPQSPKCDVFFIHLPASSRKMFQYSIALNCHVICSVIQLVNFASNFGFCVHAHMRFRRYVMSLEAISWLAVGVTTSQ